MRERMTSEQKAEMYATGVAMFITLVMVLFLMLDQMLARLAQ